MRLRIQLWILLQRLVHLGKIPAHPHTKVRQRAPRIDERQQHRLPVPLPQPHRASALIQKTKIRNRFAGLQVVVRHRRFVIGLRLRHDNNLIQHIRVRRNGQRRRNRVAGMQLARNVRLRQRVVPSCCSSSPYRDNPPKTQSPPELQRWKCAREEASPASLHLDEDPL